MDITISPEDIDNHIKKSIIESALGKGIQISIDKAVKNIMGEGAWDNPVKLIVHETIKTLIKEFLQKEENKNLINAAIVKATTPEAIETIIGYGLVQLEKHYRDRT